MSNNSQLPSKYILLPLIIALSAAIGMLAGYRMNFNNNNISLLKVENIDSNSPQFKDGRIEEILRFIETNYVDSLDENVIAVDAINHILRQLDPHSSYITPEELDEHNQKMEGVYTGVGIETIKLRDTFYITQMRDGSPASDSGLQIGDGIITVSGETVSGNMTSFADMSQLLKGEKGVPVSIGYKPVDKEDIVDVNVTPSDIILQSADISYLIKKNVAYVKISRFNSNTYEQFIKSLERISTEGEDLDLIIDLRDNPGGYLPETINILSQLYDEKDKLLTYTEGLNRKRQEYRSTGRQFFNIGKIAVLINKNSASGSEILAGAIQDWDRGFIVGESSFGKGLVQEIFPLSNGGALRLTVSKYYTPSGRLIQKSYDNINEKFVADTSDYTTKILNRTVIGGGGVTPDYKISDDINTVCYNFFDYSDYYLIDKMTDIDNYDLQLSNISSTDFTNFIGEEFIEEVATLDRACNYQTEAYLKARLKRMQEGDVVFTQTINASDPIIDKALQVIADRKTTFALLSEKK